MRVRTRAARQPHRSPMKPRTRPPDLALSADRRVRTVDDLPAATPAPAAPAGNEREYAVRVGKAASERRAAALTRRERKVKDILLKELSRMGEWKTLTYAEKQHLEKNLDVEFIDRELAKMRKQVRRLRKVNYVFVPAGIIMFLIGAGDLLLGSGFEGFHVNLLSGPIYAASSVFGLRSTRRKMFIYEALRELSDADELDVQLGRVVEEADVLIDRIVERELALEARYPSRLGLRN